MIIKEEPDISRYIKMREGEMKIGEYKLSYRLTEPVYFALTGENERLEKWIGEGMPVQGVSPQICRELTRPMYMHLWIPRQKESQGRWCITGTKIEFSFDEMQYMYLPENGGPVYYTTMEAAIMGRRTDTIRFLLKQGMKLDLRQDKLRDIVHQCDDREILEMIRKMPESHWEKLYDPQFGPPEFPEDFELPCE